MLHTAENSQLQICSHYRCASSLDRESKMQCTCHMFSGNKCIRLHELFTHLHNQISYRVWNCQIQIQLMSILSAFAFDKVLFQFKISVLKYSGQLAQNKCIVG